MVKKELSNPGSECLEMLVDIWKSRILSTKVSLFLFQQQPGDDKDNFCHLPLKGVLWVLPALPRTDLRCPEELSPALLQILKMSSALCCAGDGVAAASCILGCLKHQSLSIARQQRGWSCCCSTLQVQPTGQGRAGVTCEQGFGMPEMAGVWGSCCFGDFF